MENILIDLGNWDSVTSQWSFDDVKLTAEIPFNQNALTKLHHYIEDLVDQYNYMAEDDEVLERYWIDEDKNPKVLTLKKGEGIDGLVSKSAQTILEGHTKGLFQEVEVDFHTYDNGFFIAATGTLKSGEAFLAVDAEGNQMPAIVESVDDGFVYFSRA